MESSHKVVLDVGDDSLYKMNQKISQWLGDRINDEAILAFSIIKREISSSVFPCQDYDIVLGDDLVMSILDNDHPNSQKVIDRHNIKFGQVAAHEQQWRKILHEKSEQSISTVVGMMGMGDLKEPPKLAIDTTFLYKPKDIPGKIRKWNEAKIAYVFPVLFTILRHEISAKIILNRSYGVMLKDKLNMVICPDEKEIRCEPDMEEAVSHFWKKSFHDSFPAWKFTREE